MLEFLESRLTFNYLWNIDYSVCFLKVSSLKVKLLINSFLGNVSRGILQSFMADSVFVIRILSKFIR